MIDVNVTLSRWPFRRLPADEPAALVAALRKRGVTEAWAASFDGIFHKDLAAANGRLAKDCRTYGEGMLLPFGSVNPKLPDWQEDLRRCHEEHRMRGIRLYPNYHGYKLDDPSFSQLLHLASARGLIVQLAVQMEDDRTQPALMRVPPVDLAPLADAIRREPKLRLLILNSNLLRDAEISPFTSAAGVSFDCSWIEGLGGLARFARKVSIRKVLFGSNFPLFYFDSALLKVKESGFSDAEKEVVLDGNAQSLLAP
jgi:predicted TIM-barrel fold metal-dependent hydrolase